MKVKQKLNLIFRKSDSQFNSIENVFTALLPYFESEFDLNLIELPFRTSGVKAMRANIGFLKSLKIDGLCHLTGHENYLLKYLPRPRILSLHDIGAATVGKAIRDRFILHYWFKKPIRQADRLTVVSNFSKEEIGNRYLRYRNKIQTIPNPVDDRVKYVPKEFNEENPRILFVGTKDNKNFDRAVEAINEISCTFCILGKLSELQISLLKQKEIRYENYTGLCYEEVLGLYKQSDFLLFPSLYEGFGIPTLEAQGTGRPVITSNIGTMPNTAGDGALFVDPYSVSDITNGVKQVLSSKELRDDLVEKGLQNVKQYAASKIAKQYITLYKTLLNDQ